MVTYILIGSKRFALYNMICSLLWAAAVATLSSYVDARFVCGGADEIGLGYRGINTDARKMTIFSYQCRQLAQIEYANGFCANLDPGWPKGYQVECDQNKNKVTKITMPDGVYENCYDPFTKWQVWFSRHYDLDSCDDERLSEIIYCCKKTPSTKAMADEVYPVADSDYVETTTQDGEVF